jgi:hypothetical protein
MSYNGENSVDYTNTDPNYWSGVNDFFKNNSENDVGETGIWIPNLEKQGAESTALAASAGGVIAVGGSNYAGGSSSAGTRIFNAGSGGTETEASRAEYQDERPIKLASIYQGGTEYTSVDASDTYGGGTKLGRMGTVPGSWQGVKIQGGKVVGPGGENYVASGGDFGGLLAQGVSITSGLLDSLLGPRDSDGMRLRGTMPAPIGAATTDAGASGMLGTAASGAAGGGGARFSGGTLPSAPPGMDVDYAPWSDDYWKKNLPGQSDLQFYGGDTPNLVPGGWRPTVTPPRWGVQPGQTKPTYMAQSIYPLLTTPLGGGTSRGGGGTGLVKYAPPTGGGLIDTTKTTTTGTVPIGATTTAPGREYDYSGASDSVRSNWASIPNFANFGLLDAIGSDGEFSSLYPGAGGVGRVGGQLYKWGGGSGWETSGSVPLKTTT